MKSVFLLGKKVERGKKTVILLLIATFIQLVILFSLMDLEDFFDQIDLSALAANEQQGFRDWLGERPNIKFSIENALRKGQSVKAYIHIYRKQVDYVLRIEN